MSIKLHVLGDFSNSSISGLRMCLEPCNPGYACNWVGIASESGMMMLRNVFLKRSKDATTRIWNLPDPPDDPTQFSKPPENPPKILKHLPISDQRDITSLDWNGDGTLLATGSYDSILRVWTRQGDYYMSHPQHQVTYYLLYIMKFQALLILVLAFYYRYFFFLREKGPIFAIRFSKSGRWLLSASLDGTACVWDVAEKKLHMQLRCHAGNMLHSFTLNSPELK